MKGTNVMERGTEMGSSIMMMEGSMMENGKMTVCTDLENFTTTVKVS